jgi:mannosyltransferase
MEIKPHTFDELIHKWNNIPIFLVLLSGFLLRLIKVNTRGIWYDDAFSILLANRPIADIIRGTAADTMPPVYYFLLHIWGMISQQIWFLRSLNILLSTGSIYLIYILVKKLTNPKAAIIAGFLTAISPFQIFHAQELRMYVVLQNAILINIILFIDIFIHNIKSSSQKMLMAGMVLSGVIALYTHNLAVFTMAALDAYLLIKKEWKKLLRLLVMQGIMVVLFIPWLIFLPGQIAKIQTAFWTPRPGIVQIIQGILTTLSTLPQSNIGVYFAAVIIAIVFVILVQKAKFRVISRIEIQLLFCMIIIPPLLMFFVSWFMRPIYVPRAFIVSGVLFYAMAAVLLLEPTILSKKVSGETKSPSKIDPFGKIAILLFILISIPALLYQYTYKSFPRSEFEKMMITIGDRCSENCVIVHDNKLSYFPAYVYDHQATQVFIADEVGTHNDTLALISQEAMNIYAQPDIDSAVGNYSEVRFVVFSKAIAEYEEIGVHVHPKIQWLDDHFIRDNHISIGDLEIFYFSKIQ